MGVGSRSGSNLTAHSFSRKNLAKNQNLDASALKRALASRLQPGCHDFAERFGAGLARRE